VTDVVIRDKYWRIRDEPRPPVTDAPNISMTDGLQICIRHEWK
jgi:hypothetical protein